LTLPTQFRRFAITPLRFAPFGEALIQQSESRTVVGGEAYYLYNFRPWLPVLDLRRDAPRNPNLNHLNPSASFFPSLPTISPSLSLNPSFLSTALSAVVSTTTSASARKKFG